MGSRGGSGLFSAFEIDGQRSWEREDQISKRRFFCLERWDESGTQGGVER